MRLIFLIPILLTIQLRAQQDIVVEFDSLSDKGKSIEGAFKFTSFKILNNSNTEACYSIRTGLITQDGKEVSVLEPGLFDRVYSHDGPKTENYIWKTDLNKNSIVNCNDNSSIHVKGGQAYKNVEGLQVNIGPASYGRYKFKLPAGTYTYKIEIKSNSGSYISVEYPYPVIISGTSETDTKLSLAYQQLNFNPFESLEEKIATNDKIYNYLDTCNSTVSDEIFTLLAPYNLALRSQEDLDKYIEYLSRRHEQTLMLYMAYKVADVFEVCRYIEKNLQNVDKYKSYELVLRKLKKKNKSLAESFYSYLYKSEKKNQNTISHYNQCSEGKSYLLTEAQLISLEKITK